MWNVRNIRNIFVKYSHCRLIHFNYNNYVNKLQTRYNYSYSIVIAYLPLIRFLIWNFQVKVVCETRDAEHSEELHQAIKAKYASFIWGPKTQKFDALLILYFILY